MHKTIFFPFTVIQKYLYFNINFFLQETFTTILKFGVHKLGLINPFFQQGCDSFKNDSENIYIVQENNSCSLELSAKNHEKMYLGFQKNIKQHKC